MSTDLEFDGDGYPLTPRHNEWYEQHDKNRMRDRPSVLLHMPHQMPRVNVHTITTGACHDSTETVGLGPIMASIHLGGIEIRHYLRDLEAYVEVIREGLALARHHAQKVADEEGRTAPIDEYHREAR